jgi:phage head maturation protease
MSRLLGHVRGYASVFDEMSSPLDGDEPLLETIRPGAFRLIGRVISANVAHNAPARIGSTWDRSLRIWQDSHGLAIELDIEATPAGQGLI